MNTLIISINVREYVKLSCTILLVALSFGIGYAQACSCSGANMFANPSFETGSYVGATTFITGVNGDDLGYNWGTPSGLDGWSHGPLWWLDAPSVASEGNRLVYINNTSGGSVCQGQYFDLGTDIGQMSTCATYNLCFDWASFNRENPNGRTTTSRPAVDFTWFDSGDNVVGVTHESLGVPVANQDWNNIIWSSVSFPFSFTGAHTPPAGATYVRVNISEDGGGQDNGLLIDNANLCEVTSCAEICDNGIDDDGDGLIDCLDPDCNPNIPVITGPTELCIGETSSVTPTSGGTWTSSNASVATVTNAGVVTAISVGTVTFTFLDGTTGCSNTTDPITIDSLPTVSITGTANLCEGETTTLSPSTGGTWISNNPSIASVTNTGIVTGVSGGSVNFTFTANTTGCESTTANVTVNPKPTVNITGASNLCIGETTTLTPSSGGTWTSSDAGIATVSNAGLVTAISSGNANFTFTNSTTGCVSNATANITVNPELTASVDFMGSICLQDGSQLAAIATGGTSGFTYNWTGPNSFTSTLDTISIVDDGNYYLTITDAVGCFATTSAFVYERYEPFIYALNTEVCEGQDVNLSVNSATAVAYQWDANGGNATTSAVTVTPSPPSTTYYVTVTNDIGCTSVASAQIDVISKPTVSVSGPSTICNGTTTTLSPSSGGTWTSMDTTIATVTNGGVVTGVSPGTATFVFTDGTTSCTSDPTTNVTVVAGPAVSVTGPTSLCNGDTTNLSPSSGGTWTSSDPSIATVTNAGVVTAVSPGVVTFTYTNSSNGCISDASEDVTIEQDPVVSITGSNTICVGSSTTLSPTSGGSWVSSDPSIATVSNAGIVTGIAEGVANFVFTNSTTGCESSATEDVMVDGKTHATITGADVLCVGETTTVTASIGGGFWSSSDPSVATVNNSGLVTAISAGNVLIYFDHPSSNCPIDATHPIQVYAKPIVSTNGVSAICVGESIVLSPTTGGIWVSSEPDIASVTNSGVVTGVEDGTVTFTYTNNTTGCTSDATTEITVHPEIMVTIDFNGSICIHDNSQLSAIAGGGSGGYNYSWTGPNGFTGSTQTVSITDNGNYYVTVTDAVGCEAATTEYVYERYDPFIFTLNTDICEGESISLSVNSGTAVAFQWDANAGNSTSQSVTVTPGPPSTTYVVTVTNDIGCSTTASATITVDTKPDANVTGATTICAGETTTLSPTTGGTWSSNNNSVATVTNGGLVTGVSGGSASFIFTDSSTGCVSDPTANVAVNNNLAITISGNPNICITDTPTLTASVAGGTWSSSNTSVATISAGGVVTPVSAGNATITYNDGTSACYENGTLPITIYNTPNVNITGQQTICQGETTTLTPSSGGTWTSNDPSIATVTNSGIVTGVSGGDVQFTFTSSSTGCQAQTATAVTIIPAPAISLLGPDEICIGSTTSLSPTSGGIWMSSNNAVASVISSGIVTGKANGTASFTFTESTYGCVSDSSITILVNDGGTPTFTGPQDLCITEQSSIAPATGGTWTSSNNSVATITNGGIITAVASGMASFTYTDGTTGCVSQASLPLSVNASPTTNLTGPSTICSGETSSMSPSSEGIWTSTNESVATITNQGIITGVSTGSVQFIYTNTTNGCVSDSSAVVTVDPPYPITLTGPSSICVGETTTFAPTSGGTWSSSDDAIATISNAGVVTGVSPGVVTMIYNSFTSCSSEESEPITILAKPNVIYSGPSSICIGSITQLSPSSGGVWSSNNTSVATVTNSGEVTGVAIGTATFTFTDSGTGCSTTTPVALTVYNEPTATITGASQICIGANTSMTPSSGGTWTSSNTSVATISSTGVVTGISAGTATFTFSESGSTCTSPPSDPVTVSPKPTISITGANTICADETTTMTPTTGGSWVSNNTSVATITNSGVVTGVSQGIARFTFISDAGCASNQSSPITIFGKPEVTINGPSSLCIGSTVNLSPSSGGTWTSGNTSIATINNSGLVTGIAPGTVTFTFTDSGTGCTSDPSMPITVEDDPEVAFLGSDQICIGTTTQLTPTTGGVWTSSDPSIASVENNGQVTGIATGTASFTFMELSTGCISEPTSEVIVNTIGDPSYIGPQVLCIGSTTSLSPSSGGTWSSTNTSVATITNGGIVTAISQGTAKFRFTSSATGCVSNLSGPLTVNGYPSVSVSGPPAVCVGSTTTLSPSTGGTWTSSDPSIATVDNAGQVIGITSGTASFTYTDSSTGCASDGSLSITVEEKPVAVFTGTTEICIGYKTTLSPTSGGIWMSGNPKVATVTNDGVVTGIAPGKTTFQFLDGNTGCLSQETADSVVVSSCLNPDFNVTTTNFTVTGNISTNDGLPAGAIYGTVPYLVSKPLGSIPNLTTNTDGTYSFAVTTPGKYIYEIEACVAPVYTGCPKSMLEITVTDDVISINNPVSNLECGTTYCGPDEVTPGQAIEINTTANDRCVMTADCDLDSTSVTIVDPPMNGSTSIAVDGKITYTPNTGFIGSDTIRYSVCVDGDPGNCSETCQILTVNDLTSVNSVLASDDFVWTMKDSTVTGNVKMNDVDAEGDNLVITALGSAGSPMTMPEGTYFITAAGEYSFTPAPGFAGPVEIIYTVCDDNADLACQDATIHLLVFDNLKLNLRVYLEGALMNNGGAVGTTSNRPLMRDDLRNSPYTGENYITLIDPYSNAIGLIDITPYYNHIGPGTRPMNQIIADSAAVFSVTGENAIVDWIYIELRSKTDMTLPIATRSALVQRDGDVVELDGISAVSFAGVNADSFYVMVKHRSHLGVMSELVANNEFIDFTKSSRAVFDFGLHPNGLDYTGMAMNNNVKYGYRALWAGDFDSNGKVKFVNPGDDQNILFFDVLLYALNASSSANYNYAFGYILGDYDMNSKAKYTNPEDDKNYLYSQVLLYPLNNLFISNFDYFIEQVPE